MGELSGKTRVVVVEIDAIQKDFVDDARELFLLKNHLHAVAELIIIFDGRVFSSLRENVVVGVVFEGLFVENLFFLWCGFGSGVCWATAARV